jgi:SAM-dependent methyltransferase
VLARLAFLTGTAGQAGDGTRRFGLSSENLRFFPGLTVSPRFERIMLVFIRWKWKPEAEPENMKRGKSQRVLDFFTFPLRALTLFHDDRWGLSSLASERFDYVAGEVEGYCLDVGCGRHNRFVTEYLNGNGRGIDLFPYEGLTAENLVEDLTHLPFPDETFDGVTFIANINHCPRSKRDIELKEAFRVLKTGGRIVVTMGNPVAELLVHKLVWTYDRIFKSNLDMDTERGMDEEEEYYLTDSEIRGRLRLAGFVNCRKKYFATQWALNHLFIAERPAARSG